jgi:hypothetical protein
MIQAGSAPRAQPQALVAAESFLGQSKKQLLRKHGKNIHHRLRKTNNIKLIALAQVIRSNTRLFPLGKQLKNNLKLFVHGMDKMIKTAVALKNNGKKQGSRKQHPPPLSVQGNGACSRSLADDLIARNPGPVINTQQQTVNRYFIPPDPHASPIHNAKKEADQYKETQPVVKGIHSRDFFDRRPRPTKLLSTRVRGDGQKEQLQVVTTSGQAGRSLCPDDDQAQG